MTEKIINVIGAGLAGSEAALTLSKAGKKVRLFECKPIMRYANIKMFDTAIGYSGLGNFSSTELQKVLAGKHFTTIQTFFQFGVCNVTAYDNRTVQRQTGCYRIFIHEKSPHSFAAV